MHCSYQQIGEAAITVAAAVAIIWCLILWVKSVREPKAMVIRLGFTVVVMVIMFRTAIPALRSGGYGAIGGIFFTVAFGWILAIIWVPAITGVVGRTFGSLYDGGGQEVEPKPYYSIFRAKRQKGKHYEALAEIRKQLDKFPKDFEGQMLLAELQAENLNDLPGAALTIERACTQPGQAPRNISYALNQLADWHLGLTKDRDAAKLSLERIMELLPDSDLALRAAQRIGHLADNEMLLAPHDRQRVEVKKGVQNPGLHRNENGRLQAPEIDQEKLAAEYTAHLEQHPHDTFVREKLAVIYAKHYHRLDLALDQFEQLVQQPNHVAKQVAHWLNLMADLQVQEGAAEEQVRATLQRIMDLFPESAAAQNAQRRLEMVKLELKAKVKGEDVHLGTYEQNIGLKRGVSGKTSGQGI